MYSGGDDVIMDYSSRDKIQLGTGTMSSVTVNKSNVILSVVEGSITVKNGKNKTITVTNSSGTEIFKEKVTSSSRNF